MHRGNKLIINSLSDTSDRLPPPCPSQDQGLIRRSDHSGSNDRVVNGESLSRKGEMMVGRSIDIGPHLLRILSGIGRLISHARLSAILLISNLRNYYS